MTTVGGLIDKVSNPSPLLISISIVLLFRTSITYVEITTIAVSSEGTRLGPVHLVSDCSADLDIELLMPVIPVNTPGTIPLVRMTGMADYEVEPRKLIIQGLDGSLSEVSSILQVTFVVRLVTPFGRIYVLIPCCPARHP